MTDGPTKAAVLLDGRQLREWEGRPLKHLVCHTDVDITHVVINEQPSGDDPGLSVGKIRHYLETLIDLGTWGLVWSFYLFRGPDFMCRHHVDSYDFLADADRLSCQPEPVEGLGCQLPIEIVETLSEEVDLVIRYGFGIVKGDMLEATRFGTLSFHHGDIKQYRGGPPGVWEFYNDEEEAGVTLQRINETLDGGEIAAIKRLDISSARTWQEVRRRLFLASEDMLTEGYRRLRDRQEEIDTPDQLGEIRSKPGLVETLQLVHKNLANRIR